MKQITYRELQTRFPSELPVIITKYGIPYAKITKIDVTVNDTVTNDDVSKSYSNDTVTNNISDKSYSKDTVKDTVTTKTFVKCFLPGCMKEATDQGYFWNEDDWVEKPMCQAHAKKSNLAYESGF